MSISELRRHFRQTLDAVESGQQILITRRGHPVAVLRPASETRPSFPDLSEFRASIPTRGKSTSEVVIQMRREARY